MVAIDKIVVPAKTSVDLAPGGIHIMICDLKRNLNIFRNGGTNMLVFMLLFYFFCILKP